MLRTNKEDAKVPPTQDVEMSEATDTPTSEVINKSPNGDTKQEPTKDDKANGAEKDDSIGRAVIEVKNFSKLKEKKHYTESVEICNLKWRLLMFPHGNDTDNLSLYLDFVDGKAHGPGFFRDAKFTLEVVSQLNPRDSVKRVANHRFSEESTDWGFTGFMKLQLLHDPRSGYLKDDKLIVNVEVELIKDERSSWYYLDSKKETGYVGLKNQGATCYMNSLLQALYHVPTFRKSVYQLPTDNEVPTKSIQLALQRIFYRLQFGNASVGTKELTKSFGWTAVDSFTQHDVQELDRVLLDNLQTKMKGTKAEGTIENLFQGKIRNFIKCVDIDFESNREETYFDLSLNVKGCADVMQSLEKYVEVEMLDGSNKYHAEGHGLQAAKKGCMFLSFPSTLHLQLKRFEYDPMRDAMVKVNDRYQFPETLDLTKFMTEDADKSLPPIFHLHGVLVHSGDVHGGHYYAFIRPTMKTDWFKFDDERVTRATIQQVTEDNFGGEEEYNYNLHGRRMTQVHKKFSNAYMLVYLRSSEVTGLLSPIPDSDIPVHLKNRFDKEEGQEEVKKKEKAEAHLYMSLRVATDADLRLGRRSDLVKFENVREFRVKKNSTLKDFKKQAAEHFDIPPERQRYWGWVSRQNKTLRPDVYLTTPEEEVTLEEYAKHAPEIRLYLESSTAPETSPPFTPMHDEDILVFFKHYDASRELLHYVGHAIVRASLKPPNLVPLMNSLVGQPPNTPLLVFEEVKPNMVDVCRPNLTLRELEISNGDILVFQRTPELREAPAYGLASAPEYYDYILNRVTVKFRRLDQPRKDAFTLELSKKMLYDQVTAKLAAKLGTDASKIRLTGHNSYYDTAKTTPLKRQERMTLTDMLSTYYQPTTDTLFFESLDVPVAELENKKALKVSWHAYKPDVTEALSLLLPRDAFVSDVLQMAKGMVKLDPEHGSGKLRLMEVWTNKIHKVLQEDEPIASLNDYARLRIEEIAKDEVQMDDSQKRIHVVHFHKDYGIVQPHSSPFYQVVQRDETVSKFKQRIAARLGLSEEDVAKWKIAVVSFGKPDYLQDTDIVGKHEFANTDYLGLEHADTTTARSMHRPSEKPIKIFG